MDFVILAGGNLHSSFNESLGVRERWVLPIRGMSVLQVIADAARPHGNVISVGGPPDAEWTVLQSGKSYVDSVRIGLEAATSERLVVMTADLPDLTPEAIEHFLSVCSGDADLYYSVVPTAVCEAEYPNLKRTGIKLKEGSFTGGNMALFKRSALQQCLPRIQQAYDSRKSPLKLAKMLGYGTLLRMMGAQAIPALLDIPSIERAATRFLGIKVEAAICQHSAIGTDIDKIEHYQAWLEKTGNYA